MADRSTKHQKTEDETYHLIYWPGLPGRSVFDDNRQIGHLTIFRGEFVRLALEYAGATYTDTAQINKGVNTVLAQISDKNLGDENNPPPFAPPILKHNDILISQTSNILMYLGPSLSLSPSPTEDPSGAFTINGLTLTALDGLSNEPHETHHPIATGSVYEEQKVEAKRRAGDYRANRLPKFLGYFERVLNSPASKGGEYLFGGSLTYADLVLFQCIDGVSYAFPKAVQRLKATGKYEKVFALHERVKELERIKAYLASERRQEYDLGIYRHYPELDDE